MSGHLDVAKIKQMEDLSFLSKPQLDLLLSVEALQNRLKSVKKHQDVAHDSHAGKSHHSEHQLENEIRHAVNKLLESFHEFKALGALPDSVRS